MRPGDAVAVVVAGERARALVDPPSVDRGRIEAALAGVAASRGSSDLPSALVEAFRILERAPGPGRDVVVLGDGQRFAWRAGEPMRWGLVRDLHRRAPGPPHLWALAFGAGTPPDTPNGSLGPITTSRALVTPGMPVTVMTSLANAGPGP
ncbi:MAG: VWA domain-containing protein [Singulisphaera sp.]